MTRRGIAAVIGACAVAVVGLLVFLRAVGDVAEAICTNFYVSRTASPDGKRFAVLFERDCGATTDFSTQLSVLPASNPVPEGAGNVFGADSNGGRAPLLRGHVVEVRVTWVTSDSMIVRYDPRARILGRVPNVGPVRVVFEPLPTGGA
jgi:hypothetical protein